MLRRSFIYPYNPRLVLTRGERTTDASLRGNLTQPVQQTPFEDPSTDKIFDKFKARFFKHYARELQAFDERECFEKESFKETFDFIGVTVARDRPRAIPQVPDIEDSREERPSVAPTDTTREE